MTNCPPEVTNQGLVLWQLERRGNETLVCAVVGYGEDPVLAVYEPTRPRVRQAEVHRDIVSLVYQADKTRKALLSDGWQEVDAGIEEPLREISK